MLPVAINKKSSKKIPTSQYQLSIRRAYLSVRPWTFLLASTRVRTRSARINTQERCRFIYTQGCPLPPLPPPMLSSTLDVEQRTENYACTTFCFFPTINSLSWRQRYNSDGSKEWHTLAYSRLQWSTCFDNRAARSADFRTRAYSHEPGFKIALSTSLEYR